jgi:threonine dehydrogenase-like Zn-dependent dehydrogenase
MAKAGGAACVFGFDPLPERRDLALKLGATSCFDPTRDLTQHFPSRPQHPRLDCAVDCVGAKETVEFLMDRTREIVALFGVQREDYTYAPRHSGLTLYGYGGHWRESAEFALSLIRENQLDLAPLVTHRLPLERYNEGIELLEQRKAIKVCFLPWES